MTIYICEVHLGSPIQLKERNIEDNDGRYSEEDFYAEFDGQFNKVYAEADSAERARKLVIQEIESLYKLFDRARSFMADHASLL